MIVEATKEEVKWERGISILSSMKVCTASLSWDKQGSDWWEPAYFSLHVMCAGPCKTPSVPQPVTHPFLFR